MATRKYTRKPNSTLWVAMNNRCSNPNNKDYKNYGGRGISVCTLWKSSFDSFMRDMGPRPNGTTLDRYPNKDGNYEPGNCRWATAKEQANNRRQKSQNEVKRINRSSQYRGVYLDRRCNIWVAQLDRKHLGCFREEFDAATAYNFAAFEKYGEKAILNS